jgi:hypothetical protein
MIMKAPNNMNSTGFFNLLVMFDRADKFRESRNTIIWKLYEEETIFISAFNAENFMKIR